MFFHPPHRIQHTVYRIQNTVYSIQNTEYRFRAQSLLEALLSLALGVIFIGSSVGLIGVSLRTFNTAKQHLQANSLVRQTAEIIQSLTHDNWHNVSDLIPGIHYKLAKQNNVYVIQKGEEKIFDSQGLVSYWTFDEATSTIAYDNQSTNNGTLVNNPIWKSASDCISGSCLNFDISTWKYIEVPDSSSTDIRTNLTLEAWIYPIGSGGSDGMSTIIMSSGGYYLSFNDSVNALSCYWYGKSPAGYHTSANNTIALNQWNHVACIWDTTTLKQYINGNLVKTTNVTGDGAGSTIIRIGAESSSRQLAGTIDEPRIYNRALSAEEIKTHYQAGLDKLGLVAYWALDENGATTAYDNQSTNNGTLVNNPTWKSSSDCISGSCLSFDGSNDYVNIGQQLNNDLTNTPATLEMWVKGSFTNGNQILFGHYASKIGLGLYNTPGNNAFIVTVGGSAQSKPIFVCGDSWVNNIWNHIVVTYDVSLNSTFWLNGQQITITGANNYWIWDVDEATIGRRPTGNYFNGLIDEVRIYNRALSAEEINQRYQASYTKYFVTNKVSRSSSNIDATYDSSRDDPSTLKINSVIKYGRGLISQQTGGINDIKFYLTRSYNNQVFQQTDWSGGPGQTGPIPNPGNKFDTADSNINYASTTGSIYLTTATTTVASLTSSILDTGVSGGAGFNSLLWQGSLGSGGSVKFQIAFSNAASGPWTYYGPTATSDYYQPNPNVSFAFPTTGSASPQNNRYLRYKVYLSTSSTTPQINDIIINWSP